MRFLVWSNQHRMWWRGTHRGYTEYIDEASRYSRGEAENIVAKATLDGQLTARRTNPVTGEEYSQLSEVMVLAPEDNPAPLITGHVWRPPHPHKGRRDHQLCAYTGCGRAKAEHERALPPMRERR